MIKSSYFRPVFILLVGIGLLHWYASRAGLYESTVWFDVIMHFLGGAWVAGMTIWLSSVYMPKYFRSFASVIIIVALVGVAWEFFELYMGFTATTMPGYWLDTPKDVIMDLLGGSAMIAFLNRRYPRS